MMAATRKNKSIVKQKHLLLHPLPSLRSKDSCTTTATSSSSSCEGSSTLLSMLNAVAISGQDEPQARTTNAVQKKDESPHPLRIVPPHRQLIDNNT
mmetsp:Transcript_6025/g.8597  ORF Transcript_6025/g.8597 Transcript_6025/m.8597 type:complete len:96 (+) Transcript_6025:73-360(+)